MSQNIYVRWAKFRSRYSGSVEAAFEAFVNADRRLQAENHCSDCGATVLWLNADHVVEGNRNKRCRPCQQAFEHPEPEPEPEQPSFDEVTAAPGYFDRGMRYAATLEGLSLILAEVRAITARLDKAGF